jgi:hypothetical protein
MITWGVILWGIVALAQDPPVPGSAEAEADAAIAEFKLNFYRPGSTEDELALAVRTLGQTVHPKTLAILVPLMNENRGPFATAPVSSRIAVAMVLAGFGKIDGTPEALINAYKFNIRPSSRPVRIQIIQTLGDLKAEAAASLINAAILDKDPWIARAATKAAGRLRGSSSIDPLIKRLQHLESREGERPSDVPDPTKDGRSAGDVDRHRKSERQVLQAPIHEALNSITRQRQTCADTWAKWWAQNRKDYKVPP